MNSVAQNMKVEYFFILLQVVCLIGFIICLWWYSKILKIKNMAVTAAMDRIHIDYVYEKIQQHFNKEGEPSRPNEYPKNDLRLEIDSSDIKLSHADCYVVNLGAHGFLVTHIQNYMKEVDIQIVDEMPRLLKPYDSLKIKLVPNGEWDDHFHLNVECINNHTVNKEIYPFAISDILQCKEEEGTHLFYSLGKVIDNRPRREIDSENISDTGAAK